MTQVTQYDKNPSAEGAAARVSRAAATPSLATDTFTSWPPQGTKSHKIVATATTDAIVGLPNADRPTAAAGDVWSCLATVRNSNAASRTIATELVFYNTAGATLGTATGTTIVSATVAAGATAVLAINGITAPASTASVDVQIARLAGGGAAISDAIHFDQVTITKTATAIPYVDPNTSVFATWTGTADASTQTYWTPAISATALSDYTPVPRVLVALSDLPPGVTSLTLWRTAENRTVKVRGAIAQPVSNAYSIPDTEAGFQTLSSWRAQMFSVTNADLGYTASASATLSNSECCVHAPEDPSTGVIIDIADTSGKSLTRPTDGEYFHAENRVLAVLHSSRRRGLEDVDLFFSTADPVVASKFEQMMGGYGDDDQRVPVLCIRTPPFIDIPRTFYASTLSLTKKPITVHMGGNLREWEGQWNETAAPFAGLIVSLLSRDDIDIYYATRNAMDAAYATRSALDADYSKVNLAP